MKAYSIDLRERIVSAVDAGMPKSVASRTFQVSRATVNNYLALRRDTGAISPRPTGGDYRSRILPAEYPVLLAQLEAMPDATLAEHCEAWERSQQVRVSIYVMHRAILRADWTRKKRRHGRRSKTPSHESSGGRK